MSPLHTRTARVAAAALAGTCALAICVPRATAAPASALPATLTAECPGIGAVTVHTHAGSLTGATTDAGPVSLKGTAVTASGGFGRVTDGRLSASVVACEPVTLRGASAGQVLSSSAARRVGAGTRVDAQVRFGVSADTDAVISAAAHNPARVSATAMAVRNDPAGYGPVEAFPTSWGMPAYLGQRSSIAAAYRAIGQRVIYTASSGKSLNVTASIVKVQIMATVMYQAQQQGRALTSWEKSQLVPMITQSSNDAATALWNHVGGGPAVARVLGLMGLRDTVPGSGSYWGLTVTSAPDQVVLVDHFARVNPVLSTSMRTYGLSLMRQVESDQHWGVTAGPGSDNAVKNGWLPRTDGWHVNSVGYLDDAPRKYVMAVLSQSPSASMDTLVSRIEGASRLVWAHQHGLRGDFNGDGIADLAFVRNGTLMMSKSTTNAIGAVSALGRGWGAMTWVGTPGDVTGDGVSDVYAISPDGHLWLYPGTGNGSVSAGRNLGGGWAGVSQVATPGDFTGDGVPDLIARMPNGNIVLFSTHGTGAPTRTRVLAASWPTVATLIGAGDFNNDGLGDLLAVSTGGQMVAYASTGTGVTQLGQRGHGWPTSGVASPGDVLGDGVDDVVQSTATGLNLWSVQPGAVFGASSPTGISTAGMSHPF